MNLILAALSYVEIILRIYCHTETCIGIVLPKKANKNDIFQSYYYNLKYVLMNLNSVYCFISFYFITKKLLSTVIFTRVLDSEC